MTAPIRKTKRFLAVLVCCISLVSCGIIPPTAQTTDLFIPPSQELTITPVFVPTEEQETPIAIPTDDEDCSNLLAYIQDLTIPDGAFFSPGEKIDKRWLVENQGTCNWNSRYTLRLTGGDPMGTTTEQSLIPALAGNQATIRILFTAPNEGGKHRSAWQAYTPDSKPFGDPIFIEIEVIPRVAPSPVS